MKRAWHSWYSVQVVFFQQLRILWLELNELCSQVAEWTDEFGFSPVAAKYVRLRPGSEIEKNRTYIVTTVVVSTSSYS